MTRLALCLCVLLVLSGCEFAIDQAATMAVRLAMQAHENAVKDRQSPVKP